MKTTTNRYRYNSKEQLAEVEAIVGFRIKVVSKILFFTCLQYINF